jgi:hypothetical protein
MADYRSHAVRQDCRWKKTERVVYGKFCHCRSEPMLDEIGRVLSQYYGFSNEELDFIINYDVKYRMGQEAEGDAGE